MKYICIIYLFFFSQNIIAQTSYKDTKFTDYFQQNGSGWLAADGTISLELPDGRNMWFMGDSHIDQPINSDGEIPCLFNTKNCIIVQDADDLSSFETFYDENGTDVYERQFIKMPNETEVTYWPSDAVIQGDIVYSFWQRYESDGNEPPNLSNLNFTGMVVAKIKLPEVSLIDVQPVQYPGWEYGTSIVWDEADQYYYIYGKYYEGYFFKSLLARCTYGNLLGTWEFYNGFSWSNNINNVTFIANEVSAQYSVFKRNEKYYLFFQENGFLQCGLGRNMYIYTATEPWGPFVNKTLVYTMNDNVNGSYLVTFNGEAHPQFIENNELLISYNVNRPCPSPCEPDPYAAYPPDWYRPQFVRVPFCTFDNDIECIGACESTIILSGDIEYGTYHAGSTMNINGEVTDGSNVTFKAGNNISINSGFKVTQGVNCKIRIENCQ